MDESKKDVFPVPKERVWFPIHGEPKYTPLKDLAWEILFKLFENARASTITYIKLKKADNPSYRISREEFDALFHFALYREIVELFTKINEVYWSEIYHHEQFLKVIDYMYRDDVPDDAKLSK